jgi:hypothetical protein
VLRQQATLDRRSRELLAGRGCTKITSMTRIVGTQNRSEFILDPVEAWHRGHALDQMLAAACIPVPRGVMRAPHRIFNQIDDARELEQARLLNGPAVNLTGSQL